MARTSDLIESMALTGAAVCLAHCIALPVLIAALPALASTLPIPASFHLLALLFATPTTMAALAAGYRHHRRVGPLLGGLAGLALLALGTLTFGETPAEAPVTIAGSLAIATAHIINWRRRREAHQTL